MAEFVVPLDGSELAERAVPIAAALARASRARIEFVHALEAPLEEAAELGLRFDPVDDVEFEEELRLLSLRYKLPAFSTLAARPPGELISQEARRSGVRAVVMATHGRSGVERALLGSVAEQVVRSATVPVFLVPARAPALPDTWQLRRILVPVDGTALSEGVLSPARQLAHELGGDLLLLRVYSGSEKLAGAVASEIAQPIAGQQQAGGEASAYFAPLLAMLAESAVPARAEVVFGDPTASILHTAELAGADLIAMATHGRSGLNPLFAGSVAEGVLRKSRVPMMILGPAAVENARPAKPGHVE